MQNRIINIILFLSMTTAMAVMAGTAGCGRVPHTEPSDRAEVKEEFLPMAYVKGRLYRLLSSEGSPYCLDEENGRLDVQAADKWMRFTAVNLTVKPADLDRMSDNLNLLGADGIELNYADHGQIVFHSFGGLFQCINTGEGWKINRTLDLGSLGAGATQGDSFSLITADKDGAFISPECYSPKTEIPVTFRFLFTDNRLELTGRFEDKPDSAMGWSYSEEAMALRETVQKKLGQEALWISNLYPVMDMDSNVYGFITLGDRGLETLGYGRYWSDLDRLELEAVEIVKRGT